MAKAKTAAKTIAAAVNTIKVPPTTGDATRYIKDHNGVYHPVEDPSFEKLADEQMEILMEGLEE